MTAELTEFQRILASEGLHPALSFLNRRTPHRFTGVYRYDGEMLRNVALLDRYLPETTRGDDVAMVDAYCSIVGKTGAPLEFSDSRSDSRFGHLPGSAVVCYCGVPIRDVQGRPFGSLCHFDTQRCEPRRSDAALLAAAAPLIWQALRQMA